MFRNKLTIVCVVALLLLVSGSFAETIFEQNYDSNAVGDNPGWGSYTPCYTFSVVNTEFVSSPNSLNLNHDATIMDYATGYAEFPAATSNPWAVRIAYDVKWVPHNPDRVVWGWKFSAGSWVGGGGLHDATVYISGGHMIWNGGPGYGFFAYNPLTGNLSTILGFGTPNDIPDKWFHVEAVLYYAGVSSQKYDVTVTRLADGVKGTLTGVPFMTTTPLTPDQLSSIWLDAANSGAESEDVYLDNVKIDVPTATSTLKGKVSLQNFTGNKASVGVKVEFIKSGSVVRTNYVLLDSEGNYQIDGVTSDTYDVAFKAASWLREKMTGQELPPAGTKTCDVTLTSGDLDGDNHVAPTELGALLLNLDENGD